MPASTKARGTTTRSTSSKHRRSLKRSPNRPARCHSCGHRYEVSDAQFNDQRNGWAIGRRGITVASNCPRCTTKTFYLMDGQTALTPSAFKTVLTRCWCCGRPYELPRDVERDGFDGFSGPYVKEYCRDGCYSRLTIGHDGILPSVREGDRVPFFIGEAVAEDGLPSLADWDSRLSALCRTQIQWWSGEVRKAASTGRAWRGMALLAILQGCCRAGFHPGLRFDQKRKRYFDSAGKLARTPQPCMVEAERALGPRDSRSLASALTAFQVATGVSIASYLDGDFTTGNDARPLLPSTVERATEGLKPTGPCPLSATSRFYGALEMIAAWEGQRLRGEMDSRDDGGEG